MRIFSVQFLCLVVFCTFFSHSYAFEDEKKKPDSSPFDIFKLGFKSYKDGKKEEAVEAYHYAAENGHLGAQWKLARMYDEGDGVAQNKYKAFEIYEKIVDQSVDPIAPERSYVSHSLLRLAYFFKTGIKGSNVKKNLGISRDLYTQAAWTFRDPEAQFELGRMFLYGQGGIQDKKQALHLFKLASEKGHPAAMAMFGNMLFYNNKQVEGLAHLTAAMQLNDLKNHDWIAGMQEQAFSRSSESNRRGAMDLSQRMSSLNLEKK